MLKEFIERKLVENKVLTDILDEGMKKYPERIALVDFEKRVTYAGLYKEARRMAAIFRKEDIEKGDHVILWMNNRIEFFYVFFGLLYSGACPILLLPTHREKELEVIAEFGEAKAIVTYGKDLGYDYLNTVFEVNKKFAEQKKVFAFCDGENVINLKTYPIDNTQPDLPEIDGNDIALFLLSGGTTGIPKIIPKRHAAYMYNAKCAVQRCDTNESSVYLAALSVSHDYPLSCPGALGTLLTGGKCVLAMTASFDEIAGLVREEGVTFTQAAPAVVSLWLECMEWEDDYDFSSMKYILIGAAKLEWELAEHIEKSFQVKIIQGYGLGEGITCFTRVDDKKEVSWTCQGTPISEYDEVRILGPDGREVSAGTAGELVERGPYTFDGYYKADEMNKQVFTEDGFFRTGDKAMITEEGNIRILGRVKEQINRAGENVIPAEIEQYIKKNENIKDAAVFGMEDPDLGEKICAVMIAEGRELSITELCDFLSKNGLAAFKLPDCIYYVKEIPLINVGKVDKNKLKRQILENA